MKGEIDFKEVSKEIFDYFLGYNYKGGKVILGTKITNPFLSTRQNTPSFNIYKAPDGNLIFKDFATGDVGNCVTLVTILKGISRNEAIGLIRKIVTNN